MGSINCGLEGVRRGEGDLAVGGSYRDRCRGDKFVRYLEEFLMDELECVDSFGELKILGWKFRLRDRVMR